MYEVETTEVSGETTTKQKKHIYAGSNKVCTVEPEHTYYVHSDHLGSSNIITDGTGNKVSQYEYEPYGQVSKQTGTDVTNYKFTGKEFDDSTGLYYYGARYYDPQIGRFITADPLVQTPLDPQTFNRYAYCRNNPLKYIDPSGYFFGPLIAAICAIIKAAAVGAAVGAVGAAITGGDIGRGAMMGAVGGAFTGGLGLFGIGGALGGAMSGAATSGIFGGDAGVGALTGAIGGGIGGLLNNWTSGWNEGSFWGGLGASAISGGIAGGVGAELEGGDFGKGASQGAMMGSLGFGVNKIAQNPYVQDIAGKIWSSMNTALGLALGVVGAPFVLLSFQNPFIGFSDNAINIRFPIGFGVLTLGNVQLYAPGWSSKDIISGISPQYRNYDMKVGMHEKGHTYQAQELGPLYLIIYGVEYLFNVFSFGNLEEAYLNHPMERGADNYAIQNQ